VTVALSGDGGDELFAGYERFAAAIALDRYHRIPRGARRQLAKAAVRLGSRPAKSRLRSLQRFMSSGDMDVFDAFVGWQGYVDAELGDSLLGSRRESLARLRPLWTGSRGADLLDRLLNLNLRSYLVDNLLPKTDRMSMAHGLEVRSPFLDHELVEFSLCLPRRARVRGLSLKSVLKMAVSDLLPKEIVTRRKSGFGVPLDHWFRGELAGYSASMLGSPSARIKQHLSASAIDSLLAQHAQRHADHGEAMWTLLTLEIFLRKEAW
ncbi:MAG: asparagine synthase C-terminal domain-containing protein, partial [Actinobacteria bacterium]|nr:asparagine synthase C-terminal domain-containing protein [Actinomycetota bacterium]